jgi:6-phosphofructokinase 2
MPRTTPNGRRKPQNPRKTRAICARPALTKQRCAAELPAMPLVATLTLNPALDFSTHVGRIRHTHKLRCAAPRAEPGGGGINVARVVNLLGGHGVAVFPAGGSIGRRLAELVKGVCADCRTVEIEGETRFSFTAQEDVAGVEYRFVMPGPTLSPAEIDRCLEALRELSPDLLVVSGSLPPHVDPSVMRRLSVLAHELGVKLIADSSGAALEQIEGAYLLKPSQEELTALIQRPLLLRADVERSARILISRGMATAVLVSQGEDGALLVTRDEAVHYATPRVKVVSAVGAGDSMVGAVALALLEGQPLADAAALGVAAGTAAIMTEGSQLCRPEDVERIYPQVKRT